MADSGQRTHTATAGMSATVQVDAVQSAQRSDGASDSEIRFRTSVNEAAVSGGFSGMTRTIESSQVSELSNTRQELDKLRKEIANLAKLCKLQQFVLAKDQREIERLQQGRSLGAAGVRRDEGVANEISGMATTDSADQNRGAQKAPDLQKALPMSSPVGGDPGAPAEQFGRQMEQPEKMGGANSTRSVENQRNLGPKISEKVPGLEVSPGAAEFKPPAPPSKPPLPPLVAREFPGAVKNGQALNRDGRQSGAAAPTEPPSRMRQYDVQQQPAAKTWVSSETPVPPALHHDPEFRSWGAMVTGMYGAFIQAQNLEISTYELGDDPTARDYVSLIWCQTIHLGHDHVREIVHLVFSANVLDIPVVFRNPSQTRVRRIIVCPLGRRLRFRLADVDLMRRRLPRETGR